MPRKYFDRKKVPLLDAKAHEFINTIGRMWLKKRLADKMGVTEGYIDWVWDGCPNVWKEADEVFEKKERKEKLLKKEREDREAVTQVKEVYKPLSLHHYYERHHNY